METDCLTNFRLQPDSWARAREASACFEAERPPQMWPGMMMMLMMVMRVENVEWAHTGTQWLTSGGNVAEKKLISEKSIRVDQ